MKKIPVSILLIACLAFGSTQAATVLWDALPAMEAEHFQGLYAGQRVCPMCQHGYDSGVMVFVPASISPAAAHTLVARMTPQALGISSQRFRVFVIMSGRPSKQQLDAFAHDDRRWFVAALSGSALDEAEHALDQQLKSKTWGYVFAQRRLLHVFTEQDLFGGDTRQLKEYAAYAVQFLSLMYPETNGAKKPDSPQGALWFAPSKLTSKALLENDSAGQTKQACFVDSQSGKVSNALATVASTAQPADSPLLWARTSNAGCMEFGSGLTQSGALSVTLYSELSSPRNIRFASSRLAATSPAVLVVADAAGSSASAQERIIGLPCEGCDLVFVGRPATLQSQARIAPQSEPGDALHVQGRVFDSNGKPAAGVTVYGYHTNREGVYPRDGLGPSAPGRDHGRLRGWAVTDSQGRYTFDTIRPAGYPNRPDPAHIHMHVIEPGRCTYYISNIEFDDDARFDKKRYQDVHRQRGGVGLTHPLKDGSGVWQVTRDIYLGRNIPDYETCGSHSAT